MSGASLGAGASLAAAGEAPAPGPVLWRADGEKPDLAQWDARQLVRPDRARLVASPRGASHHALRFEVRQGDNPLPPLFGRRASGDRAELVKRTREQEGDERWYEWRTMFAPDFPRVLPSPDDPYTWQIFIQWHQDDPAGGSPPVYFQVLGDEISLGTHALGSNGRYHAGPIHWRAPIERGRWHRFRLHVRWSADPRLGFLELWHDGELALARKAVRTLVPGQGNYLKLGLYRSARIQPTGVLFHDGLVMSGPAREDDR